MIMKPTNPSTARNIAFTTFLPFNAHLSIYQRFIKTGDLSVLRNCFICILSVLVYIALLIHIEKLVQTDDAVY